MNLERLKEVAKITLQEISVESGVGTSTCHNYFSNITTINSNHCVLIENAVVAIARKRILTIQEELGE